MIFDDFFSRWSPSGTLYVKVAIRVRQQEIEHLHMQLHKKDAENASMRDEMDVGREMLKQMQNLRFPASPLNSERT